MRKVAVHQQAIFQQLMLDAIPLPVYFKAAEGHFLGCNTAFEHFTGWTRDELVGKTADRIFGEEHADAQWKLEQEVVRGAKILVRRSRSRMPGAICGRCNSMLRPSPGKRDRLPVL